MPKFTLLCDDRTVYVDGDPRVLDPGVELPEGVHAIQWRGARGWIEFKEDDDGNKPENEEFFDLSRFQAYVDAHAACVLRDDEKRKGEEVKRQAAEAARAKPAGEGVADGAQKA